MEVPAPAQKREVFLGSVLQPLSPQKNDQENLAADPPCQRIRPEHHLDPGNKPDRDSNITHPAKAPHNHHDKHRHHTVPGPPLDGCHTVGKSQEGEKRRVNVGFPDSDGYRFRLSPECPDQIGRKNDNQDAGCRPATAKCPSAY